MLLLVGEYEFCWILFVKVLYKHNLVVTNRNWNNYFVGSMSNALFKEAHDSFRREVLYNILIEFGIPMK